MKQGTVRPQVYEPTSDAVRGTPISGHVDRSGSTIHGSRSVGFGSLFVVVGATLAVLAVLDRLEMSNGVPRWLGWLFGVLFAIAGMSFVVHGILGVRTQRRVQRLRETHVREPWVWDHPWDERGSRDDSSRRIARAVWFTGFLALFLVPFNWVGFFSPERPVIFALVALVMDCVLVGCAWRAAYLIGQRAKYGPAMLRFRRFPCRPGGEVELHMARPARLVGIEAPVALLRCVQERYETRGSGRDRSQVVVAYELWSDRQPAEFKWGEFVWRFMVPDGVPGTALSELPPRYWELEVKVETSGVDFAGVFLVPVYVPVRGGG